MNKSRSAFAFSDLVVSKGCKWGCGAFFLSATSSKLSSLLCRRFPVGPEGGKNFAFINFKLATNRLLRTRQMIESVWFNRSPTRGWRNFVPKSTFTSPRLDGVCHGIGLNSNYSKNS
ncbi:unnamed protein product [Larinioides sclopetarius]|uniref:Uncharacterized protein n=1 Tax=Larinioides sclopetarius TaxID=280406 RepID=A0AAV2BJN3_9ARAC